jgi:hypothetical protein
VERSTINDQRAVASVMAASGLFRVIGHMEIDCTARNDRRYGVLVDHLGDGVFQQDDILIERLDVPLKLDTVDQIDRDRDMLLAQEIQKRILQKLAFVTHDMFRVESSRDRAR